MQNMSQGLGTARYQQLQDWLETPRRRVERVVQVTSAWWWPEGPTASRAGRKQRPVALQQSNRQRQLAKQGRSRG
jgi:hypothetical protein